MTHEEELKAILRETPGLMRVMRIARDLALPDWMVFSGAIYQPVFNRLTGREPDYGVRDYDLAYFDASDISYEAEDLVIRRAAQAFPPPFDALVEVRNQARVHLWFEGKFGEPYAPLASSAEALERFVSTLGAVGVRLDAAGELEVFAPFGLEDLFALRIRRNPVRVTNGFEAFVDKCLKRWPELTVAE